MSTHEDFPAELVEARAMELCDVNGWRWDSIAQHHRESYRRIARLSLRREVEACEPLVRVMEDALEKFPSAVWSDKHRDALAAHRARYAPKPETLADVAREAAEALRGNAALSERLLAAVEREVKP